ncbi:hypothetical protein HMN09_01033500 [Mycena chlorophos]|uniref:Uncharacterized protein n=1 Tax=Mycena chlorophos TaxID=658473 RepID=A0A8H6SG99_MYCCL|nr:hypothetical protein HMN09_01033500 [Mycena chlorophos]
MANFAPALNDLIQVMYQEPNVFVAISEVDIVMDRWHLRVVQVGGRGKGKWWKGGWDGAYVQELLRSSSDTLIALQAQTRQSRLSPSAAPSSVPSSSKSRPTKAIPAPADTEIPDAAPADRKPQQKQKEKEEKVVPKKRKASEDAPARGSVAVRRAGASVINPQRQARKVQAIEFESDED